MTNTHTLELVQRRLQGRINSLGLMLALYPSNVSLGSAAPEHRAMMLHLDHLKEIQRELAHCQLDLA